MRKLLLVVMFGSASCIFGGGGTEKNSNDTLVIDFGSDVAEPDSGVRPDMTSPPDVGQPGDASLPPDDMDVRPPDMALERFLMLEARPQPCDTPRTAWFAPTDGAPINGDSHVATAGAPGDGLFQRYLNAEASVGFATPLGDSVAVFMAVVSTPDNQPDGERRFSALNSAESTIPVPVGTEVYGISLTPLTVNRTTAMPVGELMTALITTSAGVFDCSVTVDMNDDAAMVCGASPWNETLATLGIQQPARLDVAPQFEFISNEMKYGVGLLGGFDAFGAVSGPDAAGGETLAMIRAPRTGAPAAVTLQGVEPVTPNGSFGERLAFGVSDESFGLPVLLMIENTTAGMRPVALRADNFSGSTYTPFDLGQWRINSRLDPTRESFTFVDEYDITAEFWPARFGLKFSPGDLRVGYVGIAADNESLVFSRPGGFGGDENLFLEFPISSAVEIAAFKNIPLDAASSARSPIALIHGANRDRLAVFDWGFSTEAKFISDLLAPDFVNARRMTPNWWTSDSGTISMLAQRQTAWVIAAVAVPDLANLSSACQ